jgi:hypothetical protein
MFKNRNFALSTILIYMIRFFIVFLFLGVSLSGCKTEDDIIKESLVGEWDVYASKINKRDNDFVRDGWFEFMADNKVASNLFPDQDYKNYDIENQRLIIEMSPPFDLKINEFRNDSMHLEGKLSYYYMEYFLVKRPQ